MKLFVLVSLLASTVLGDLRGFDVSQAQAPFNNNFWKCAHNAGYGKAVIRGYRQACGVVRLPSHTSVATMSSGHSALDR